MRIFIVGGGIGGLTAARAMLDAGFTARVFERRSLEAMKSGPGGIFIQKNAMRVFEKLAKGQIAERLYQEAGRVLDGGFFDVRGRPLYINRPAFAGEADLGVAILRPTLQGVLYDSLPAGTVQTDAPVVAHRVEGDEVVVQLESGEELRCDVLVGADGLRSQMRARLAKSDRPEPPLHAGQTCWRGVFRAADVSLDKRYTWQELWGVGSRFGYFDTGRGTCSFYGFVNATAGGADAAGARAALREAFAGYGAPVPQIIEALDEQSVRRDDIFDRDPPGPVWGEGPVTLLGDAAHPSQPTLGQGGCMAIEDAFELARALRRGQEAGRAVVEVLREHEGRRTPRVGRVVRDSRMVAAMANTPSRPLAMARDWMYRLTPRRIGDLQFRWLFDYRPEW